VHYGKNALNARALFAWILASATISTAAGAQSPSESVPNDETVQPKPEPRAKRYPWRYHRFDWLDFTITGASAAGFLAVNFGVDPPREARWSSTTSVDDEVRGWLRADSREGRDRADRISDYFWYTSLALPWMDLAFPLLGDNGNTDTAWQMAAINVEAFSVSGFLTRAGHRFVARERPDVAPCRNDAEYNSQCFGGSFASYPSGHTSTSAVGAGLVCAHHLKQGLVGNDIGDGMVCGLAATAAVGAGVMRIIADRHYVTDVLSGAAIGFGSGLALPLLRNYRIEEKGSSDAAKVRWTMMPTVQGTDGLGLAAYGWF
jgi:membrane-associated phospholipid phosphatase